MRCVSAAEAEALLGEQGFSVSLENDWYRSALILDKSLAHGQRRIAAEQPSNLDQIDFFVRSLNMWLAPHEQRLFWADHWDTGRFGGQENALATLAWRGIGEKRTLQEAPGLLFDAQDWNEEDQLEITSTHAEASGVLVGLVTLLMMTYSDGWLIATNSVDRVEFWEGHFFFHSGDEGQLARANAIVDEYDCKRWKTSN